MRGTEKYGEPLKNVYVATASSGNPLVIDTFVYSTILLMGFAQGIGSIMLAIKKDVTVLTVIDLFTGNAFTNADLTFSATDYTVTVTSAYATESRFLTIVSDVTQRGTA